MFSPVWRQRDAGGLEDAPDLARDRHVRGDALAVLLGGRLPHAVEIADQIVSFDADLVGSAESARSFCSTSARNE